MKKKEFNDKIKIRYLFYTIYGWGLFIIINFIQFFIFMPIVFILSIFFDKNKKSFPYLVKFFCKVFFTFYVVERLQFDRNGLKAPEKGEKRIYVLNHASQYDVILIYLLPGPIRFLLKESYAKLPMIGWIAVIAGNIVIKNRSTTSENINVYRKAVETMEETGSSLVIFPEGTKSKDSKIGSFFNGTFKLAIEGQAEIVPVIFDSWNCIRPGAFWIRDIRPTVKLMDPIKYESFKHLNYVKLSQLMRVKMIEGLLEVRDNRRKNEPNYYRHYIGFEKKDDEMREELKQLKAELLQNNISLNP